MKSLKLEFFQIVFHFFCNNETSSEIAILEIRREMLLTFSGNMKSFLVFGNYFRGKRGQVT